MFSYESNWSDAAVRRFIGRLGKVGAECARGAARAARGRQRRERAAGRRGDRRAPGRIAEQLRAELVLDRAGLAVDGNDLMRDLGLAEGPLLGRILDELLEQVIADPARNERSTLLGMAQAIAGGGR